MLQDLSSCSWSLTSLHTRTHKHIKHTHTYTQLFLVSDTERWASVLTPLRRFRSIAFLSHNCHQNTNFHNSPRQGPLWSCHKLIDSHQVNTMGFFFYQWPATYTESHMWNVSVHTWAWGMRRVAFKLRCQSDMHTCPLLSPYTVLVTSVPVWDSSQHCGGPALCWFWVNQVKTNNLRTES